MISVLYITETNKQKQTNKNKQTNKQKTNKQTNKQTNKNPYCLLLKQYDQCTIYHRNGLRRVYITKNNNELYKFPINMFGRTKHVKQSGSW